MVEGTDRGAGAWMDPMDTTVGTASPSNRVDGMRPNAA